MIYYCMRRSRKVNVRAGAALLFGLASPSGPALAQSGIWTLQEENAKVSAAGLTDHFYTNGIDAAWMSPAGDVPVPLAELERTVWGGGDMRYGFGVSQQIYTPADTGRFVPDPRDRPYAGVLTANLTLLRDTADTRDTFTINAGLVGPDALAELVQNGAHNLIRHPDVRGWNGQIANTPVIEALTDHIWRVPVGVVGAMEADVLPAISVAAGDLRDYVQAGMTVRIGQGLDADFGVPRIRPGLSGGDAFTPVRAVSWYVFAGVDGQAVGYDLLLQTAPFRSGPHVSPVWDIGEGQVGVAAIIDGMRLTLAYVAQTQEFHGQSGGLHQFGSFSLSVRF